jgi:hypothetical protein
MKKHIISFFILFLLISCATNKEGFIEFKHIGDQDKAIESLRIVKKKIPSRFLTEVIIVNEKSFNYLFNYLTKGRKEGIYNHECHEYGSFRVTIARDSKINFFYVIDGRVQSLVFFQGIVEYLKQNDLDENLQEAINKVIIRRIDHPYPVFLDCR